MREADAARATMELLVIGVGRHVSESEIMQIAGKPGNVFMARGYASLATVKDRIVQRICQG